MNYDDLIKIHAVDTRGFLDQINGLPDQLQSAWTLGHTLDLPDWSGVRQIILAGMGGSAIGADLAAAYVQPDCKIPLTIHRDYDLPGWASGAETLVIAISHSGETEETLSALAAAVKHGCQVLAITRGGSLAEQARAAGATLWQFQHAGQPRMAVGWVFGLTLSVLERCGWIEPQGSNVDEALHALRNQQTSLMAMVPVSHNPAKRLAGQLVGRWAAVFGAEHLAPVARRWKGQLSEVAKTWGQFDVIPEADHNTLAGLSYPEEGLPRLTAIFLQASSLLPRNLTRMELTRKALMTEGISTDFYQARGERRLAHLWTSLLFGDYVMFYLALANGVDPTPVESIEAFKQELAG